MSKLTDKISYLQGLAEGMKLNPEKDSHRLILGILDVLGEVGDSFEALAESHGELADYVESIDQDLADLEAEIYDDEDNPILTEVLDYFFYNGEEYVLLAVVNEEEEEEETDEPLEVDCFVMKVREFTDENGEEMEEFIPVDDDDLEGKLLEVATQYLDELNNPETEEE